MDIDHENREIFERGHERNVLARQGITQEIEGEHGEQECAGPARNGGGICMINIYALGGGGWKRRRENNWMYRSRARKGKVLVPAPMIGRLLARSWIEYRTMVVSGRAPLQPIPTLVHTHPHLSAVDPHSKCFIA